MTDPISPPLPDLLSRWRVVRSTLSNLTGKVVSTLVYLALVRFLVHRLGDSDFGLWVLVGSVVAYGSLFDFGIASAITKYVAEVRATGEEDLGRRILASALWLYCGLGAGVTLITWLLAPVFPELFSIAETQQETAVRLVMITGLGIGLAIPCAAPFAVLQGLHRFDITSLLATTRVVVFAVCAVVIVWRGGGVLAIAVAQIVVRLLIQVPAIWWVRRLAPELRFGFRSASLSTVRRLSSFSWALFITQLGGRLQSKTDEMVIGARLPVAAVTPYSLAIRLAELPQALTEQFLKLILPMASELHAQKDRQLLRSIHVTSTKLTVAVATPVAATLSILAAPILTLWVGAEYSQYAPLVVVLSIAMLIDNSQWPAAFLLQGMNRHRLFAVTSVATGVVNVVLSFLLIPSLGLMGVAIGTLVPAAAESLFVILPYALHVIGVGLGTLFMRGLLPALLPAVPHCVVLLLFVRMVPQPTLLQLLGGGALGLATYTIVFLLLGANRTERVWCRDLIRGLQLRP